MIDLLHLTDQLRHLFIVIIVVFLFSSPLSVYSQDEEMYRVVPPSPQAEAFSRYGAFPVNLATGAASVNIPVYTYHVGELSIPISLGYQTTALKVDATESVVGLGWVLNAGGVITRTIMDQPDEEYVNNAQQEIPYPENPNNTSDWYANYFIDKAINVSYFDTQPDEFSYNFMGNGGKFIFSREGEVLTIPRNNFRISKSIDGLGNGDFIITTPDGVAYHFGGGYEEISYVESVGGSNCPRNFDRHRVTSWYLYKVEHPNGTVVYLEYENAGQYKYDLSATQTETLLDYQTGANCEQCDAQKLTDCRSVLNVEQSQKLSRIYSPGMGEVNLNTPGSSTRFLFLEDIEVRNNSDELLKKFTFDYRQVYPTDFSNDKTTNEPRTFLTSFTEVNPQSGFAEKTHSFEYENMNSIAPRLSYAQDHWGYFNGANNQSLLPLTTDPLISNKRSSGIGNREPDAEYAKKGMLKSVKYPTGGTTTFSYEPHTVYTEKYQEVSSSFLLRTEEEVTITDDFFSSIDQSIQVTLQLNKLTDDAYRIHDTEFKILKVFANGSTTPVLRRDHEVDMGDFTSDQFFNEVVNLTLCEGCQYRASIKMGNGGDTEGIIAIGTYQSGETTQVMANVETGGVRLKQVVERPESNDPWKVTTYDYSVFGSANSSGIKKTTPRNISTYSQKYACNDQTGGGGTYPGECVYKKLSSSSVGQLYSSSGNHIYYTNVTIGHGTNFGNGREEVTFMITAGDSEVDVLRGNIIPNAPLSNAWGEGLEEKREIFSADGTLVKRVTNNWYQDLSGSRDLKALLVVDQTGPIQETVTVDCTEADRTRVYRRFTCTNSESGHVHRWSWGGNGPGRCIADGAINEWTTFATHPCTNSAIDSYTMNKYDLIDLSAYYRRSAWYYNRSVVTEEFRGGDDPVEVTQNFYYDNPAHLQLTRSELLANGQDVEQHLTYIPDYDESLTDYHISELNKSNFILPVKSENTVNGKMVSGSIMRYNEIGQPIETYAYESRDMLDKPTHQSGRYVDPNYFLKNELFYHNNRVAQITKPSGTTTSYIWGFNGNYPVAKIENVSFDDLQSASVNLEPSTNISEANADLIYSMPSGYVTLYSYKELVGLVSVLDPNRDRGKFKYDDIGRLEFILDRDDNVINQYSYGYRIEPLEADFAITPLSEGLYINQNIELTAKKVSGRDNDLFSYEWSTGGVEDKEVVSYSTPGNYDISLSIDYGNTEPATVIKAIEIANRMPVVDFTMSEDLFVYESITFDGSESYDPDGNSITYSWSDGGSAGALVKSYDIPGTKEVSLTVTDQYGAKRTITKSFEIVNRSPIAQFTLSGSSVGSGESFSFDGRNSYDPEGSTLNYRWYYRLGSGTPTSFRSGYENSSWTIDQPGNYTITLEVEDEFGAIGTLSRPLEVQEDNLSFKGRVVNSSGNGVPNIRVNASPGQYDNTNSNGYYEIQTLPQVEVTVTPTHSSYTFSPPSRTYNEPQGTVSGINFVSSDGGASHSCDIEVSPNIYTFPDYAPNVTYYFSVSTSASSYSVIESSAWINIIDKTSTGFKVSVNGNIGNERQYQIEIKDSEGCSDYLTITQESKF